MKGLRRTLEDHSSLVLEGIAQNLGIPLTVREKPSIVENLIQALQDPQFIRQLLDSLTPQEEEALNFLLSEGGKVPSYRFGQRFGRPRRLGAEALRRVRPWEAPINAAERLYYLGLVAQSFDVLGAYRGEVFFIPDDLLPLLPKVTRPTIAQLMEALPTPPTVREADLSLVRDIYSLLVQLDERPLVQGKEERATDADWRRLRGRLSLAGNEAELEMRLSFILALAQGAGLAQREGELLRLGPSARDWLEAPMPERSRILWAAWQAERTWNDLWKVPSLQCRDTGWRNDPLATRYNFLKDLRHCPTGLWLSLDSFVRAMEALDPDFQRPDGDYTAWYIQDAQTDEFLGGFQHWMRIEGALIRFYLACPLHWLGAVALGYQDPQADAPVAFLITELGASFLGLPHQPIIELPRQPLVIEEDFRVRVPMGASLYDRFQVERFAELEVAGEESVYRIEERSMQALLRRGVGVEQMLRFLERASGGSVPVPVAQAMRGWAQGAVSLRLRQATLLECQDAGLLRELSALPQFQGLISESLSPRAVVILPGKGEELVARLKELGYELQMGEGESVNPVLE